MAEGFSENGEFVEPDEAGGVQLTSPDDNVTAGLATGRIEVTGVTADERDMEAFWVEQPIVTVAAPGTDAPVRSLGGGRHDTTLVSTRRASRVALMADAVSIVRLGENYTAVDENADYLGDTSGVQQGESDSDVTQDGNGGEYTEEGPGDGRTAQDEETRDVVDDGGDSSGTDYSGEVVSEQPPHRTYHRLYYTDSSDGRRIASFEPADPNMVASIEAYRTQALEGLTGAIGIPKDQHDAPVVDIRDFYARLGLKTEPTIVFDRNEQTLAEIAKWEEPGALEALKHESIRGLRSPSLSCCYVVASSNGEIHDPELVNDFAAHELGHSTLPVELYYATSSDGKSTDIGTYRAGYIYSDVLGGFPGGAFPEEGRAAFLASQYARTRGHEGVEDCMEDNGVELPPKYVRRIDGPDGAESFDGQTASSAAIGFELLAARDPDRLDFELLDRFIAGDPRLGESIEAIQPGLWQHMNENTSDELGDKDFFNALTREIIDTFYGGDNMAPLNAATRVDKYVDERLRAGSLSDTP